MYEFRQLLQKNNADFQPLTLHTRQERRHGCAPAAALQYFAVSRIPRRAAWCRSPVGVILGCSSGSQDQTLEDSAHDHRRGGMLNSTPVFFFELFWLDARSLDARCMECCYFREGVTERKTLLFSKSFWLDTFNHCSFQIAIIFEKGLQKESHVAQIEFGKVRVPKGKLASLSVAAARSACLAISGRLQRALPAGFSLTDAKYARSVAGLIFAVSTPWHLDLRGHEFAPEETDTVCRAILSSTSLQSLNKLRFHGVESEGLVNAIRRERCAENLGLCVKYSPTSQTYHSIMEPSLFCTSENKVRVIFSGSSTDCLAFCSKRKAFAVRFDSASAEPVDLLTRLALQLKELDHVEWAFVAANLSRLGWKVGDLRISCCASALLTPFAVAVACAGVRCPR